MKRNHLTLIRISALYTFLSIAGIFITGAISPLLLLFVSITILLRLFSPHRTIITPKIGKFHDLVNGLVLLLYMVLRIVITGGDLFASFIEALLIFQGVKWLCPLTVKDLFLLTGIAYIEVVATASLTSRFIFLPIFTLLTIFTTIILFVLFLNAESDGDTVGKGGEIPLNTHFITFLGGVGLISMVFTIIIFISIPRLGVGFFGRKIISKGDIPGASGKIDLVKNTFSNADGRVIARIKDSSIIAVPVYLKSITLSEFNNNTWFKKGKRRYVTGRGRNYFITGEESVLPGKGVDIFLEPTGDMALLTLPETKALRWDWGRLYIDGEGDVMLGTPLNYPVRYTLYVNRSKGKDPIVKSRYLNTADIPGVIFEIAKMLEADRRRDSDKVFAIQQYLLENHSYKRSPEFVSLNSFLGKRKSGNCQHFATSTVLLARAMGIAARLAGGYLSNEYNDIGNYWMIRQRDAHAWAEVFIDGIGWTVVDSTPPGQSLLLDKSRFNHMLDWISQNWQEYVVGYNLEKQMTLSKGLLSRSMKLGHLMKVNVKSKPKTFYMPLLVIVFLALCFRFIPSLKGKAPLAERANPVYKKYLKPIIRDGEKLGVKREPTDTPSEYLHKVRYRIHFRDDEFRTFTSMYNRARFGKISPGELVTLQKLTHRIKKSIRDKHQ